MTDGRRAALTGLAGLAAVALLALVGCSSDGEAASDTTAAKSDTASTTTEAPTKVTIPSDRPAEIHLPPGYDPEKPAPLLVLLHGYGVTGDVQDTYLKMTQATDKAGIITVHPDGTVNQIGKNHWNATDACCAGPNGKVDDSAYLSTVIDAVKSQYNVDPKQVFLVGHSNGGFMSYRMACDHADVIAAIVSLEAATYDDPSACTPSEPVSTLEVHGLSDTTIFYDGNKIAGRAYPSAPDTVKMWADYDGCSTKPTTPAPEDRQIVNDLPPASVTSYDDCDAGGHAELWTQPEGVHIPAWTDDFSEQLVAWLQDHPKP